MKNNVAALHSTDALECTTFPAHRTRMHYVPRTSHWMQKHVFGVTCPSVLFVEIEPGPPEHEE
jgi:hypothetical protein